jgi:hypothetical protein
VKLLTIERDLGTMFAPQGTLGIDLGREYEGRGPVRMPQKSVFPEDTSAKTPSRTRIASNGCIYRSTGRRRIEAFPLGEGVDEGADTVERRRDNALTQLARGQARIAQDAVRADLIYGVRRVDRSFRR